jgi:hypothetical protein
MSPRQQLETSLAKESPSVEDNARKDCCRVDFSEATAAPAGGIYCDSDNGMLERR